MIATHPRLHALRMGTALTLALLSGCANLDTVRDFAGETRKITVAFDPFLAGAVTQCEQKFINRKVYAGAGPIRNFDAQKLADEATALCKPIAQKNATARQINTALAAYAAALLGRQRHDVGAVHARRCCAERRCEAEDVSASRRVSSPQRLTS